MQRLSARDALCLYQERSPDDYMHSMRVAVVRMSGRDPLELRDVMARIYSGVPPFRWRLDPVPLGLHHPLWRTDPAFDVHRHLRRMGCPAPGGDRELSDLVAELASSALPRDRPLWACWIVEGLAGGRCAVVTKVHHALADGVATGVLAEEACQARPTPLSELLPVPAPPAEEGLGLSAHLALAARDVAGHLAQALPAVASGARRAARHRRLGPPATSARFSDAPALSLNGPAGPHRSYAFISLELEQLKPVRRRFDATVNDVFLAAGASALRRLLGDRGEMPDAPLVACVPVSTRSADERESSGNRLGTMAIVLRTDVADAAGRIMATKAGADAAKRSFGLRAGAHPEDYLDCLPPPLQHLVLRAVARQARRHQPVLGNLGMSNVPGPRDPLYLADFEIDQLFGVGPLAAGHGMNITAWSYAGQLTVSFLASRDALPDLWPFAGYFHDALEEMTQCPTAVQQT